MILEFEFVAWLNLAIRWLHFVAGISWIGASFYFVWLDNSLRAPKSAPTGVGGELWAVHGGGFYHNQKYLVAPDNLPEELHWFKWEAYTTWLSGFALLILIYYFNAETYLIDSSKAALSDVGAVLIGLGVLVVGWVVYDTLCRSPLGRNQTAFGIIWFLLLTAALFGLTRLFTDKGAFIHVGAIIGTVMAANVFMVIIPNQKKAVSAMIAGEKPAAELGAIAKQRSVHNNYMTLPVLLIMISGHYPLLVGHALNWLLLGGLAAASIAIRHFSNLRNKGSEKRWLLGLGAIIFLATALLASLKPDRGHAVTSSVDDSAVMTIVEKHCANCHAADPTHPGFPAPAGNLVLETSGDVIANADAIVLQAVDSDIMPLGNESGMSDEERAILGQWLEGQSK